MINIILLDIIVTLSIISTFVKQFYEMLLIFSNVYVSLEEQEKEPGFKEFLLIKSTFQSPKSHCLLFFFFFFL